MSFGTDISRFVNKTDEALTTVFRRSALITFSSVIKRTPVRTGLLRSNWQFGMNVKPTGNVSSTGKSFGPVVAKVSNGIKKAELGNVLYLINNLPYAEAIEGGHSRIQAPNGMVKLAVAEWNHTVALQAMRNKKL